MSTDPDKIDFSALDPSRHPAHWEALVQQTLARRRAAAVHPLFASLASRGQVALLLAAALAVMAWLPSIFAPEAGSATASVEGDAATRLALWASSGDIPADANMFAAFGGDHVSE